MSTDKASQRAEILFAQHQQELFIRTDRLFAVLLFFEWLAGIAVALFISPVAWAGSTTSTHPHVWEALIIGGIITSLPVYLAWREPGRCLTRHIIGASQMLFSALFIHLSGGRIETHFHVFGSLAVLAFYRDWRVLVSASAVVALDHGLRGAFWPQSVFGVQAASLSRTLEHVFWVVVEDIFLIKSCIDQVSEMRKIAMRQAELEETRNNVEAVVTERTAQLRQSERRLGTQHQVSQLLADSDSLSSCASKVLTEISEGIMSETDAAWSAVWIPDRANSKLQLTAIWHDPKISCEIFTEASQSLSFERGVGLPGKVWQSGRFQTSRDVDYDNIRRHSAAAECGLRMGYAFPVILEGSVHAVIELFVREDHDCPEDLTLILETLGKQIGQYIARKQSEAESKQLAKVVEYSCDAICGINADRVISSWNRGAKRLFGYSAEEAIGQDIALLCGNDEFIAQLRHALSGQPVEGFETVCLTKNESEVDVSMSLSPIYEGEHVAGMSAIYRDVTERKIAEKRVTEFYSTVSHELRTPLTSIRGALGLLEGGVIEAGSAEGKEMIQLARTGSDRLIRLISDILDLRKIEAGRFELQLQPVQIDQLVSAALEGMSGMAVEKDVCLVSNVTDDTAISCDWDRCTQVLTNLIGNAIKFASSGTKVIVSTEAISPERIKFSVTDNGPGISEADMPKLFQKFQQIDASDTRQLGGTGLGLAICKALVEQHHGTIGVHSVPGHGSTFWFELPVRQPSEQEASQLVA